MKRQHGSLRYLQFFGWFVAAWLAVTERTGHAHPNSCASAPLSDLLAIEYTSSWHAYEQLSCLETRFRVAHDRRAVFLSVYALTTRRIAESVDAGYFEDSAWVAEYQTRFANYYRRALQHYERGQRRRVPRAWLAAFDSALSGQTLILQDALLGMNAHINFDLAYAVRDVQLGPDRARAYRDHTRINDVLLRIMDEVQTALGQLYGPGMRELDVAFGHLDERVFGGSIIVARQIAWQHAEWLAAGEWWWQRQWMDWWMDETSGGIAGMLLGVSLEPGIRAELRRREGSDPTSEFCRHFPCADA
ncbi:MAG: hypothetical protein B7733_08260 [Myxococcales bacterium FL481]|nr:MAG: hypothetical protein B7733_08260 [Myxococcales bacterium FL481]